MNSIEVDGGASAEEIAAVLAAIAGRRGPAEAPADGYAAWRRGRLAALARLHPGKQITDD
jgi:hypothetical protein